MASLEIKSHISLSQQNETSLKSPLQISDIESDDISPLNKDILDCSPLEKPLHNSVSIQASLKSQSQIGDLESDDLPSLDRSILDCPSLENPLSKYGFDVGYPCDKIL